MSRSIHNNVRTLRKQAGFSQEDLAYLINLTHRSTVSRVECAKRLPSMRDMLALLVVFQSPIEQVFPASVREVEDMVKTRAKTLYRSNDRLPATLRRHHRHKMLRAVCEGRAPVEPTTLWTTLDKDDN